MTGEMPVLLLISHLHIYVFVVSFDLEVVSMVETRTKSYRLSIDVDAEVHRRIKMVAAVRDETIRTYVSNAIRERLQSDLEYEGMLAMSVQVDPVLSELWDNEKDSAYDNL